MYEAFYGFSESPFTLLPDPSFLYLGKKHKLAYAMLEYGLFNQAGFSVITGEVGSGKTTLIHHLLNQVTDDINIGLLTNTQRNQGELLQWILLAFGQDYRAREKVELFDAFTRFVIDQYAQNKRTVLIIDEAQNLEPLVLEELRMLSNINANKDQVLQLILVGQPQLKATLRRPELEQFAQRVVVDYHLAALSQEETRAYIQHRIVHVGGDTALFSEDAADRIYQASKGIPRVINVLCQTALVYGFADQRPRIELDLVESVLQDKAEHGSLKHEPQEETPAEPEKPAEMKIVLPFDMEMAKQLFNKFSDK
ncbi:MAG: AAA family ATPase [Gammaproteobacteria bacterium]|nr:AAA family ATPase [Gammaproteobacteria bacterium]